MAEIDKLIGVATELATDVGTAVQLIGTLNTQIAELQATISAAGDLDPAAVQTQIDNLQATAGQLEAALPTPATTGSSSTTTPTAGTPASSGPLGTVPPTS